MNYHGFGGLKVESNEYLSSMLHSPPVEHEVKMSWGNRLAGGSKDNPYLQVCVLCVCVCQSKYKQTPKLIS